MSKLMRVLHIAKDLSLPLDAVTQTFAEIGRKGAGKTYLASMIAEQMLDIEAQVVAIDPVGNWFGLRVGADGKSTGKDIFVIGGEHGDVPLTPEAGVRVAKLIVEKRISAVLDVSAFRIGERKRFAAAFGEELFHLKKTQRTPMHLFVEEAQLFIPQRVGADEARMVGAFESIIRLGRNYGIGASLITQRPQSVNKEVLSQVECLCVLQVNGSHERKALDEWVQEAGADRKLVGELPGLERGEGYVWSPSWLRIFKRVHFSKKTTFDASATPEVGRSAPAARLSAVDVEALRADLADVVAAAEKDDPRALRRRIAELELGKPKATAAAKVEIREVYVVKDSQVTRLTKAIEKLDTLRDRMAQAQQVVVAEAGLLREALARATGLAQPALRPATQFRTQSPSPPARPVNHPAVVQRTPAGDHEFGGHLKPAERRILEQAAAAPNGLTKHQLGIRARYRPDTGHFGNMLSALQGYRVLVKEHERYLATDYGKTLVPDARPLVGIELREKWRHQLGATEWKLLSAIIDSYPNGITKEDLAAATGYRADTGHFGNLISTLTGGDLVEKRDGRYCAMEEFFIE